MDEHNLTLSLGSNTGNPYTNLEQAMVMLQTFIKIKKVSSAYITSPLDYLEQEDFINIAITATTTLSAQTLIKKCMTIQHQHPFKKTIEKGPRGIDIDIIFYDNLQLKQPNLQIPHPRYHQRKFVLIPLIEIMDQPIDPHSGKALKDLLNHLPDKQGIAIDKAWSQDLGRWL